MNTFFPDAVRILMPKHDFATTVGQRIKANLYRANYVGKVINYGNGLYQVKAHTGVGLSCFPGGAGILEMELELVKLTDPHKYPTKKDVWDAELELTGKTPQWHWTE